MKALFLKIGVFFLIGLALPADRSTAAELVPFLTRDQSPLTSLYGLPPALEGSTLSEGRSSGYASLQIISHSTASDRGGEAIQFDGETYRFTLGWRYGFTDRLEAGIELPLIMHRGGFLDSFITDWHDIFNLPQGGRDETEHNQLLFTVLDGDEETLRLSEGAEGIGDVRLSAAIPLLDEEDRAVALRITLKLPTGDPDRLLGSGSTDLALWVSADQQWSLSSGKFALFGTAGALALTQGDLLPERQRHLVGFGCLGGGWAPWEHVAFKVQLDGHTPLYDSDLRQLGSSLQLTVGGTLAFTENTSLDLGVSEDIAVDTAPDVVFHFGLRHGF